MISCVIYTKNERVAKLACGIIRVMWNVPVNLPEGDVDRMQMHGDNTTNPKEQVKSSKYPPAIM